jgi:hypothetical protein
MTCFVSGIASASGHESTPPHAALAQGATSLQQVIFSDAVKQ